MSELMVIIKKLFLNMFSLTVGPDDKLQGCN